MYISDRISAHICSLGIRAVNEISRNIHNIQRWPLPRAFSLLKLPISTFTLKIIRHYAKNAVKLGCLSPKFIIDRQLLGSLLTNYQIAHW